MPPMPAGREEGILKGMYRFRAPREKSPNARTAIRQRSNPAMKRCRRRKFWKKNTACPRMCGASPATRRFTAMALTAERWNLLHPGAKSAGSLCHASTGETHGRAGRGFGLPEDAAESDQPSGRRGGWRRWEPMDSAAAKVERRCVISLKWMRGRSFWRRCTNSARRENRAKVVDKAIKDLGINPDKPNPVVS